MPWDLARYSSRDEIIPIIKFICATNVTLITSKLRAQPVSSEQIKPSLPDGEGFLLDWFLRYTQH